MAANPVIVVLDGHTLNPGDLSWGGLQSLGTCRVYDRSAAAEVASRARDASIVLTNKTVLAGDVIGRLEALRYIGVLATGYNVVDIEAARARGIPVCNVPTYGTRSVAQMTLALLLELTQRVGPHAQSVRDGRWSDCPDFCYWDFPLVELDGLTMGVVGYGRIGRAVGELAAAFGMKVLAQGRRRPEALASGVDWVDLPVLLGRSDVVSLHCPLTESTQGLMNRERLSWMKPGAYLLNTSRGGLVDEAALADALRSGRLAGAALDVMGKEPPQAGHPLFSVANCIITPHIAWATRAARGRLMEVAVDNVRAFLQGKPRNVVNSL